MISLVIFNDNVILYKPSFIQRNRHTFLLFAFLIHEVCQNAMVTWMVLWSQELYESCQSCLDVSTVKEPFQEDDGWRKMLERKPHWGRAVPWKEEELAPHSLLSTPIPKTWQANTALHLVSVVLRRVGYCCILDLNNCSINQTLVCQITNTENHSAQWSTALNGRQALTGC